MVTTTPHQAVANIGHDRTPLILDQHLEAHWLDTHAKLEELLDTATQALLDLELQATEVHRDVINPKHEGKFLLQPAPRSNTLF